MSGRLQRPTLGAADRREKTARGRRKVVSWRNPIGAASADSYRIRARSRSVNRWYWNGSCDAGVNMRFLRRQMARMIGVATSADRLSGKGADIDRSLCMSGAPARSNDMEDAMMCCGVAASAGASSWHATTETCRPAIRRGCDLACAQGAGCGNRIACP